MGEVFAGHYELVDLVGAGSSGAVWRAWDHRQQTYVSAKVMRQHDAAALVRFVREHSGSLRHPHVLLPRAWAGSEEQVLFAADLVRGGSVADLLAETGPLPDFLVAQLLEQVLSALSALHARGLVHRDVRASKLLLEPTGSERPHCWLSGFSAVAVGDPTEDLRQLGRLAAELATGLYPDPATGPGPAPAHLPEGFWTWIRRTSGHAEPATAAFSTADEAGAQLQSIELVPQAWPLMHVRVPDRLGELPGGWEPDGPGASRPAVSADPAVSVSTLGGSGTVVYEEIPSLPHVVPPVVSGLTDEDVSDDDGFAELAELLPTDPAYADSAGATDDQLSDVPPERPDPTDWLPKHTPVTEPAPSESAPAEAGAAETTADLPPVVDRRPGPHGRSPSDQPEDVGWPEATSPPDQAELLEPEHEVVPAQLTDRAGFVPPTELDAEDEQDDAEEFQPRPIRVPHPPRSMRLSEDSLAAPGSAAPAAPGSAARADQTAPADQTARADHAAAAEPSAPAELPQHQVEMWETGEWMAQDWSTPEPSPQPEPAEPAEPPAPLGSEPSGEWPTERPSGERALHALSEPENRPGPVRPGEPTGGPVPPYERPWSGAEAPPDLPPLELDETEPSRWRRVLLVLFAIVALVGAVAGTWYLVIRYR